VILSQTAEYALRATIFLAGIQENRPYRVEEIAESLGMPRNYLSKILHALARAGVLASLRGPRGGFQLAIPAQKLPLKEVVRHFDPFPEDRQCLLRRERCGEGEGCAAHARWKNVASTVEEFFEGTTVGQLSAGEERPG
jgi:Rrf2 family protein